MAAYRFSGYWKDVGTLESLWDANMDMLSPESGLDLLDESWPIYARSVNAPPAFLGRRCQISHSAFNRGRRVWRGRWRTPSWLPLSPWGRGPGCPTPSCSPG